MPLVHSSSKKAFEKNLKTEIAAGKPMKQSLAIAYNMKRRNKMAKGGVAAHCPDCMAKGGQCMAHGGMAQMEMEGEQDKHQGRAPEMHLDNEAEPKPLEPHEEAKYDTFHMKDMDGPHFKGDTSGSPTEDMAAADGFENPLSVAEMIMKRRKDSGSSTARYAKGGYVDSSEDDFRSEHDYSYQPAGHDAQTIPGEHHDSDMPDEAQQESLVGQIIKKRRQLKK